MDDSHTFIVKKMFEESGVEWTRRDSAIFTCGSNDLILVRSVTKTKQKAKTKQNKTKHTKIKRK